MLFQLLILSKRISGEGFLLLLSCIGRGSFGLLLNFLVMAGFTSIESAVYKNIQSHFYGKKTGATCYLVYIGLCVRNCYANL